MTTIIIILITLFAFIIGVILFNSYSKDFYSETIENEELYTNFEFAEIIASR